MGKCERRQLSFRHKFESEAVKWESNPLPSLKMSSPRHSPPNRSPGSGSTEYSSPLFLHPHLAVGKELDIGDPSSSVAQPPSMPHMSQHMQHMLLATASN